MDNNTGFASSDVVVIPASKPSPADIKFNERKSLRVAAYCRVSTGDESQQTSYTMQKNFYTSMIKNRKGWKFAGIYADEAISGTSRSNRKEFNLMMEDALNGKFDYIVTKSISRFARNTIDALECVRQLKLHSPPVGIYFEKENIDTLDAAGELILTILSALAQDESRSISENIRWTFRKNFQNGKPQLDLNRMLGYDKGKNGEWIINEEQADIVRYIFTNFEKGMSANRIAVNLNSMGKYTVQGNKWRANSVFTVLRNEKYVGDVEMQKTITESFLTHRSVKNKGEAPKYYIKNHHAPIIERKQWERVQEMIEQAEKTRSNKRGANASVFNDLLYENKDGRYMELSRMMYKRTAKGYTDERALTADERSIFKETYSYAYPVWRYKSDKDSFTLCECSVEQSFMEMLYRIKRDPIRLTDQFNELYGKICEDNTEKALYDKPGIINMQIEKLKREYRNSADEAYRSNLKRRISELRNELAESEGGMYSKTEIQNNFNLFMEYVDNLPDNNVSDEPMCIYGLDTARDNAYDYIPFDKLIYMKFIKKGIVKGNEICYFTTFGITLKSKGNLRKLDDFIGFRKSSGDRTYIVQNPWQIYDNKIQYRRVRNK